MVEGERGLGVRVAGEGDQPDQVVGAPGEIIGVAQHELAEHRFNGVQTVDLVAVEVEIQGLHAAGNVHQSLDRDALGEDAGLFIAAARPGQLRGQGGREGIHRGRSGQGQAGVPRG